MYCENFLLAPLKVHDFVYPSEFNVDAKYALESATTIGDIFLRLVFELINAVFLTMKLANFLSTSPGCHINLLAVTSTFLAASTISVEFIMLF